MNIYKIQRTDHTDYDEYDSAVVVAPSADFARNMHPSNGQAVNWDEDYGSWCNSPDKVRVTLIGTANPDQAPGVVVSSYNAG